METWTHHRYTFPLPDDHKFPLPKYALLAQRLVDDGVSTWDEIHESVPTPWDVLALVHEDDYLRRVRDGELTLREQRALGLPWSAELVERGRRSTYGTLEAAAFALEHGVGMNLGGGTHHAGYRTGRGYCLFNDIAVATAVMRTDHGVRRVLVVDCDVHQGDGTAELLGTDPDVFTLSIHGARNYPFKRIPSSLDVDLPTGTGDDEYLQVVDQSIDAAFAAGSYDIAFYLAGADPWEGDRLGRLALTKPGLRRRDERVLERLADIPTCVVLAGGYAPDVNDTVDINAATAQVVAARLGA